MLGFVTVARKAKPPVLRPRRRGEQAATATRPIWRGAISFGLVSVPVRMIPGTESKELRFHVLHKDDLAPIGYDKVRKDTGEHVDPGQVALRESVERTQKVNAKKPARRAKSKRAAAR